MKTIILVILGFPLFTYAQTGPGGVGTNDGTSSLKMWYRPEFGVSATGTNIDSWLNGAGIVAHNLTASGTNRPTLLSGTKNGYNEISFDGNDILQITGALTTTNFITNQASSFLVTQRNSTTSSWVYATSPHQTNRFSCHVSWSNSSVYFDLGSCCSTSSRLQVNGLANLNDYSYWSYDALNATGKQLYRNSVLLQNRANTTLYNSHGSHTFRIGENFNGNITEIIIYKEKINSAQRIIIENYLSAKYDITSSANDLYDEDNAGNGNYDFDVAGIGRINGTNIHNDAQGTGFVRVLNPAGLNDDEFLIWGHNNGLQQAIEVTDIPATIQARFDRVWRVSEVNTSQVPVDVGAIDIQFDLTGLGAVTTSDLRLLIDTDNDGVFNDETPIAGATNLGSNVYQFAGITALANNLRFTLGTINTAQTPLPIKLVNFMATEVNNRYVKLNWQTASEVNNDYFTIERSQNGNSWKKVIDIDGMGNSSSLLSYSTIDDNSDIGVSYYRLKQTDFDGQFEYSKIISVNLGTLENSELEIYPNPTNSQITITGNIFELGKIEIYNVLGQNVTSFTTQINYNESKLIMDLSNLNKGIYYIKTKSTANKLYKQ